jgi:hypothetical protein
MNHPSKGACGKATASTVINSSRVMIRSSESCLRRGHRGGSDAQRHRGLPVAQPSLVKQAKRFSDVSHGGSGPRHRYLAYLIGQSCPREAVAHHPCRSRSATPTRRVHLYFWNGCAFTPGIGAPFRLERVRLLLRRAQSGSPAAWCCSPWIGWPRAGLARILKRRNGRVEGVHELIRC